MRLRHASSALCCLLGCSDVSTQSPDGDMRGMSPDSGVGSPVVLSASISDCPLVPDYPLTQDPCTADGICRKTLWPTPQGPAGIWVSSDDTYWVVSSDGSILSGDKQGNLSLSHPSCSAALGSVFGSSPSDIWVVGSSGAILHFDGKGWTRHDLGTDSWLTSVGGSGPGDIWTVGSRQAGPAVVFHWDGAVWSDLSGLIPPSSGQPLPSPQFPALQSVWAADPGNVWAVGGSVLKWDGRSFTRLRDGAYDYRVWGSASDDVWITGVNPNLEHWDGTQLAPVDPTRTQLSAAIEAIWGTGRSDIWLGNIYAGSSQVGHFDGSRWTHRDAPSSVTALAGSSSSSVFALGRPFGISHWDGASWASLIKPQRGASAVWGADGKSVWAVGGSGTIVKWDGSTYTQQDSGTAAALTQVFGLDASRVWAVGLGVLLRWDGTTWKAMSGVPSTLSGIWGSKETDLWGIGSSGGSSGTGLVHHFDGSTWTTSQLSGAAALSAIHGTDASNVWVLDSLGQVFKWDGAAWEKQDISTGGRLRSIFARAADDVWAVGLAGATAHWDGATWTAMDIPFTEDLAGVYGSAGNSIWAVGSYGRILHWNGSSWQRPDSGTSQPLTGVWVSATGELFVAAPSSGQLLHKP